MKNSIQTFINKFSESQNQDWSGGHSISSPPPTPQPPGPSSLFLPPYISHLS